jgi:deazaflavin-dependent oxidoreductase (nitroreductase family)
MSEMHDFNQTIIEEFRANHGQVASAGFEGAPLVLLHTKGAKSGAERINPLVCLPKGDTLYVFASKGGAPTNPDWYYNLVAHPAEVTVEFGPDTYGVTAAEVTGSERDELYAEQVTHFPGFAEYQEKAGRVIPVVALQRNG